MGASAIRLVIAELLPEGGTRILEEATRGVSLGRDTFSSGSIRSQTIDATLMALENFRHLLDQWGVVSLRAVATSAVREARNGDVLLDRIQGRTGIAFEVINEAEESRLVFLAVRQALGRHAAFGKTSTLLAEVGGGSTGLTLLDHGQPVRSGVYALGAVRLKQRLKLHGLGLEVQQSLLRRSIANVVDEIRLEIPLGSVTEMVATGGDIRFAASQILDDDGDHEARVIPRRAFLDFCEQIERLDEEQLVSRFRLPAVEAETLVPALLIYRTLLTETASDRVIVSDASLRTGALLDLASPGDRESARDFEQQVLAGAEAVGHRFRFDEAHGAHVAVLAAALFDQCREDHRLTDRDRLLLQVAALLHDIGMYVSLRAHHKHSGYLLSALQLFGLSDDETAIVSNIARYHRGALPQDSHLPYVALDRHDRLVVSKLAALLRVANALDAEHLQKVQQLHLLRQGQTWVLDIAGAGDLTMERLAASARADLFSQMFGRDLVVRAATVRA
jgi:exopolyphosphatase/guanosine-5'-triphosphate,3'-diphosphate pyrophosphatase